MFPLDRRSLLAGAAVAALATGANAGEPCDGNIVDALVDAPNFNTLVTAVQAAGLTSALQGDGPLTLFAPTDRAFAKLPPGVLDLLLSDTNALTNVLLYHVAPDALFAADVVSQTGTPTLQGEDLSFQVSGANVLVDNAQVLATDFVACNGVIHVIDEILLPSLEGVGAQNFDVVGNLAYLDAKTGAFATLLLAAEIADLVGALQGPGPLTMFAPTERAFAALPPGMLSSLIADPAALADVLLYHVVGQELFAVDVVTLTAAPTLQGADLTISSGPAGVFVDNSEVIYTDIDASNGVVHVIDAVLTPPMP